MFISPELNVLLAYSFIQLEMNLIMSYSSGKFSLFLAKFVR